MAASVTPVKRGDFLLILTESVHSYVHGPSRVYQYFRFVKVAGVNQDGLCTSYRDYAGELCKVANHGTPRQPRTWSVQASQVHAEAFWAAVVKRGQDAFTTYDEALAFVRSFKIEPAPERAMARRR
jgi:hypothetical protein